ncbi:hypothetical protein ACG5V6_10445, partial [Streptomyces chitinivorans]
SCGSGGVESGGAGSGADGGADEETPALLRGRPLLDGRPAAYVCRHFACDAPTADPERLARTVGAFAGA